MGWSSTPEELQLNWTAGDLAGTVAVEPVVGMVQSGMSLDSEAGRIAAAAAEAAVVVVVVDQALVMGSSALVDTADLVHRIAEHMNHECSAQEPVSWQHCW